MNIEQDFERDIWCLLGLPFDNYSIETASDFLDNRIKNNHQCVLATPNLNWVVISLKGPDFKKAVIKSDASIIDGAPIFWAARLLGMPFKERVPGATLVSHILSEQNSREYSIFFFGAKEGVAEKAFKEVNAKIRKAKAVGYLYPGYASVDELSSPGIIEAINSKNPDILFAALGAQKGVLWLDKNRHLLNAKLLSHTGAAVDFIAGSIKRAPQWMQRIGIEWIWRIIKEPILAKRYIRDGIVFVYLALFYIIPYAIFLIFHKRFANTKEGPSVALKEEPFSAAISIKGICNRFNISGIRRAFKEAAQKNKDIELDFLEAEYIDSAFLGLMLLLYKYQLINKKGLILKNMNRKLRFIIRINLLGYLEN